MLLILWNLEPGLPTLSPTLFLLRFSLPDTKSTTSQSSSSGLAPDPASVFSWPSSSSLPEDALFLGIWKDPANPDDDDKSRTGLVAVVAEEEVREKLRLEWNREAVEKDISRSSEMTPFNSSGVGLTLGNFGISEISPESALNVAGSS